MKNASFREFLLQDDTVSIQYPYSTDTVSIAPVTVSVTDTVNPNSVTYSSSSETKSKGRKKYEDSPEFTEFWDAYPKHQGKTVARAAFERVDVPLQVLLDAIKVQKRSKQWTKDGGEFIPMPATWLNQKRWEDSMDVNVQESGRYDNLRNLAEEFDDE